MDTHITLAAEDCDKQRNMALWRSIRRDWETKDKTAFMHSPHISIPLPTIMHLPVIALFIALPMVAYAAVTPKCHQDDCIWNEGCNTYNHCCVEVCLLGVGVGVMVHLVWFSLLSLNTDMHHQVVNAELNLNRKGGYGDGSSNSCVRSTWALGVMLVLLTPQTSCHGIVYSDHFCHVNKLWICWDGLDCDSYHGNCSTTFL
jgi:hypothetical protein